MKGFLISIKPLTPGDRNMVNSLFYGKVTYKKEKDYAYYNPGMLDLIPYRKTAVGKIFVESLENMNIELLKQFAEIIIIECERDIHLKSLQTGEQHWKLIAGERGKNFRRAKRMRKILQYNED